MSQNNYIDEMGVSRNITICTLPKKVNEPNVKITPGTRVSTVGALGIDGLIAEMCYERTMTALVFRC